MAGVLIAHERRAKLDTDTQDRPRKDRAGTGSAAELGVAGDPPLEPSTGPRPLDFGPWPPQRRENESVVLSLPTCGRGSGSARSWSSGPVPGTTPRAGSQRADALAGRGGVTFIICVTAPNPTHLRAGPSAIHIPPPRMSRSPRAQQGPFPSCPWGAAREEGQLRDIPGSRGDHGLSAASPQTPAPGGGGPVCPTGSRPGPRRARLGDTALTNRAPSSPHHHRHRASHRAPVLFLRFCGIPRG